MNDIYFMNMANELALKAKGMTSPNPLVGAVVVKKGKIIGRGYHKMVGKAHAEVFALNQAASQARGAALYVTLEPCSHFGRTPACLDRVLASGVTRVIIGMKDPNPINNGRSIRIMRNNGINVKVGVLEKELALMNESFIKYITKKMPFVTVKIAQSIDGKIATKTGDSKWITSQKSRVYTHRMRKFYDAILVGINTVLKDDPMLSNPYSKKQPLKIIVDSSLKIPLNSRVLKNPANVIIATSSIGSIKKYNALRKKGVKIFESPNKDNKVNLRLLFKDLAKLEIANILVEGGGKLTGSLFDQGLVDKVICVIAPRIIGGKEAVSSVEGSGIQYLSGSPILKNIVYKRINQDLLVEGYVQRYN